MIVYAGAIMVLFVFVIMLLNAGAERPTKTRQLVKICRRAAARRFSGHRGFRDSGPAAAKPKLVWFGGFSGGGPREIGTPLFTRYLLPFEVTSVLILIAIIGAIVLARKEMD